MKELEEKLRDEQQDMKRKHKKEIEKLRKKLIEEK